MELNGEQLIAAPIPAVWEGLNDIDVLAKSIPGCEEISRISPEEIHAKVMFKIGPVRARFSGKLLLSDVIPNQSCSMSFEGSGGAAGFAKGRSRVELKQAEGGTLVSYTTEASIGGKLGQIGGRLISASAKKIADDFFQKFATELGGEAIALDSGASSE
ncbi:CoxG family protein [Polynucleobacter alcilacus]|jgi:carbon monoxide dehydrogenase subunit G|uniref:CoxG family protein n=1 Tax=Polynucleobacter alcilacus TaxID=1819739 RepID=UPI001C0CDCEA|nr:carbon monoxide dehydrogenase subunit G [Polynucleobacter alcilacus]MBU3567169.1 carbon monoxide dehydrogenase subunit G [Polynucleobacter alcilacus]